jgi:hypothetical protein
MLAISMQSIKNFSNKSHLHRIRNKIIIRQIIKILSEQNAYFKNHKMQKNAKHLTRGRNKLKKSGIHKKNP